MKTGLCERDYAGSGGTVGTSPEDRSDRQRCGVLFVTSVDASAEAGLHGPKPRKSASERNAASAPPPLGLSPANAFGVCPE